MGDLMSLSLTGQNKKKQKKRIIKNVDTTRFSFCVRFALVKRLTLVGLYPRLKISSWIVAPFFCGEMGFQNATSDAIIFFKPCHQGRIFFFFEWVKKARVADKVFCLLPFFYLFYTNTHKDTFCSFFVFSFKIPPYKTHN